MAEPAPSARSVHTPDCGIWKTPDSSTPEILLGLGYEDESVVAYLSAISPIYNGLSRILAQFSGLLLLAAHARRPELSLDHSMYSTALEQLGEAEERLAPVTVPTAAERHFQALKSIIAQLRMVTQSMDGLLAIRGEELRFEGVSRITRRLHLVQKLLIATAEPGANIAPVDFTHGCCNCGRAKISGPLNHY